MANDSPQAAPPGMSRVRRVSYDTSAVAMIAETLGLEARPAPFRLPGAEVYQILMPGSHLRPEALVTLWPSIRRVDAISPAMTVVFTRVVAVEIVPEVEVLFRRSSGEYLIVTRSGKIIVRA
ncbi:MAG: hypothetical protein C4346_11570 [Chloroflexota bacterium]